MSSLDDSVIIISQFCHKCNETTDILAKNGNCSRCRSTFIAEITDQKVDKTSDKHEEVANQSVTICSICLDSIEGQDSQRVLKCKHRFHNECINRWLSNHKTTCPMCRKQVFSTGRPNFRLRREPMPIFERMERDVLVRLTRRSASHSRLPFQ